MRVFSLLLLWIPLVSYSQERCAVNQIKANTKRPENAEAFEIWLSQKKAAYKSRLRTFSAAQVVYEIPVVFHVIHKGEPEGEGTNIPDARIVEQLEILNEDFRRMNPDTVNTPSEFDPVAADAEISFVLARQDPEGLPTDGIVRVEGAKNEYAPFPDDPLLKSESYWPAEDYLNIYVTDISGNHLGYAQFPFSNLQGIETELENYRLTDGVVLDYKWVGNNDNTGSFDSRGRTATHEIGHYLGLRHVWGDGGCSVDDHCGDTPAASTSTTGCPVHPVNNTCPGEDHRMFQNFMDYTDDACMNLFTLCQRDRMRVVLENSPRRKSLRTSHGLKEPIQVANDLGIREILSPTLNQCNDELFPSLRLRNYGTNTISQFRVDFYLNDELVESISEEMELSPLSLHILDFSPVAIPGNIPNELWFEVTEVNNGQDGHDGNNNAMMMIAPVESKIAPYLEDFENNPVLSVISETGDSSRWQVVNAPYNTAFNQAASLSFYNETEQFGILDMLFTRVIDMSPLTSAQVSFKYAYAPRSDGQYLDGLIVGVSADCGQSYYVEDYLFERYGTFLGTTASTTEAFVPNSSSDWDEVTLDLTRFAGNETVQVAFIGVNGGGNNLYLDSISITSANLKAYDLGIRAITGSSPVTCETDITPRLEIKNYGYETIHTASIVYETDDLSQVFKVQRLNLQTGHTEYVKLQIPPLQEGPNENFFFITAVNDTTDQQPSNNGYLLYVNVNDQNEPIPVRETFDEPDWTMASRDGQMLFEPVLISNNPALKANGFASAELGQESWLVSPVINTGNYDSASLKFRVSYANRPGYNDNLRVLLSVNCGRSFDEVLYNKNADELAIKSTDTLWAPGDTADWKTEFVSLTEHLNWDKIRIAFVFTNGNGNNLYLDDIDLLTIDDPKAPAFAERVRVYPNPATTSFKVALKLPEKETIRIQMVDLSGRIVFDHYFPNTLNQYYEFNAPSQSGIYLVRIKGTQVDQVKRVYIRP